MIDPVTGYAPTFIVGPTYYGNNNLVVGTGDITHGCDTYGTNDNVNITDTSTFVPVIGAWYNAIVIYHKGSVQFYINGTLISSKTGQGTEANLCPNSQLIIGAWWNTQPIGMNGKLDNVRLYNRVLTPHEIIALSSNYQITSNSQQRQVRTQQGGAKAFIKYVADRISLPLLPYHELASPQKGLFLRLTGQGACFVLALLLNRARAWVV